MKNIKKILFTLACFFVAIITIKADLTCDVRIEEDSIIPDGDKVNMNICDWTIADEEGVEVTSKEAGESDFWRKRRLSYEDAYNAGLYLLDKYYTRETPDAKSVYTYEAQVPMCSSSKRKVYVYSQCDGLVETKAATTNYCSSLYDDETSCKNHSSHCSWTASEEEEGKGTCSGSWKTCDSSAGYSGPNSSNMCTRKVSFEYKAEASSGATADSIKTAIKKACLADAAKGVSRNCDINSCHAPSAYNSTSTYEFGLHCPIYKCVSKTVGVNTCTPSFSMDDIDAYCVNPTDGFPAKEKGNNYSYDYRFNVRECANSYSTAQCGYANILIEAAYHNKTTKISKQAINLALRLWSYRTNRSGFDETKTGVANLISSDGNSCDTTVWYMKDEDGNRDNVYALTHKYIMETAKEKFADVAYKISDEKGYLPDYIANPEKDRDSFTGETFEKISCDLNLIGVPCGDGSTYRIAFELFFNTLIGNKYMISHLDSLYEDVEEETVVEPQPTSIRITDNQEIPADGTWYIIEYREEDLEPAFGEYQTIKCDESDPIYQERKEYIEPFCSKEIVEKWINTRTNEEFEITQRPDVCDKSFGCRVDVSFKLVDAICRKDIYGKELVEVYARVTPPKSSRSIKRLVSCGDTTNQQEMYIYSTEEIPGTYETMEDPKISAYPVYVCEHGCDDPKIRVTGNNYIIDKNVCDKTASARDGYYQKTIADPSLACIVNLTSEGSKFAFDYSEYFGVNTNFCRIYCSDQVEYTLGGYKLDGTPAGKGFIYDVRENASTYTTDYKFTAVVKQKRSCVSDIYHDNLPKNVNWKTIYGLTDEENEALLANPRLSNLMEIIARKDTGRVTRTENLNQIAYDLYNCNLYAPAVFSRRGLTVPSNNVVPNVFNKVKTTYSSTNNYGYSNMNLFKDIVTYQGGSKIANYENGKEGTITGTVGVGENAIKTSVVFNNDNTSFGLTNVKYCTGLDCLEYNSDHDASTYNYSKFTNTNRETSEPVHGYILPTNRYALFEVTTESNFYNNDKYQILPGTGNVIKGHDNPGLYEVPIYTYPLDKYAYNTCKGNSCDLTQTISVSSFHRINNDQYKSLIEGDNQFNCSINVEPTVAPCYNIEDKASFDICTNYRKVDPEKIFPGDKVADNWNTDHGKEVIEQIENNAYKLVGKNTELLQYSIKMNPVQIKAIKEYNKANKSYLNEEIGDCEKKTVDGAEIYVNCTSSFLKILRGNDTRYAKDEFGEFTAY